MDTGVLIYFAFAGKINLNIFALLFYYIIYHFLKGNTDITIITLSLVVVKSNYVEKQYCNEC